MDDLKGLKEQEAQLRSKMENSLNWVRYEERRLAEAIGQDKKVSETMRKRHYEDAMNIREKLFEVQKKIEQQDN